MAEILDDVVLRDGVRGAVGLEGEGILRGASRTGSTANDTQGEADRPEPEPDDAHAGGGSGGHGRKSRRLTGIDPRFSDRLYRYGFVALDRAAPRRRAARLLRPLGWSPREIGPIELWTHSEADSRIVPVPGGYFVFLGDAVPERNAPDGSDPFSPEHLAGVASGGDQALYAFLDTLAGRFALLVVEENRTRVFHDALGARTVFYAAEAPFAVASHATLLADCLDARQDPKVRDHTLHPGFRTRKTKSLPGDLTLFRNIFALIPNNLFDSATMRTRRYWPREPRREVGLPAFQEQLDMSLGALARHVSGRYQAIFGATGGADSRLAMAGFHKFGVPFETATWKVATLSPKEQAICRELVARTGAPHRDVPSAIKEPSLVAIVRRNSGGYRAAASSCLDAHSVLGDRSGAMFVKGLGGEVLRGFFNLWPTEMTALTPAEMARLYYSPKGDPLPKGTLSMFKGYFARGNYAGLDDFGFDPNDIFYWEHRMGMWSGSVYNEFDIVMRSIPAFNSRALFVAAFGLPVDERLTKQLFLTATARLDPRLEGLPIDKLVAARHRVAGDPVPARPSKHRAPGKRKRPPAAAKTLAGKLRREARLMLARLREMTRPRRPG